MQTQLAPQLIHFLEDPFLCVTLKCLTEIAGSSPDPRYDEFWVALFSETMRKLEQQLLPQKTNIMELSMFMCTMLRQHRLLMERRERENVHKALDYLLLFSEMEETEIFKICLEYWNVLVADLYRLVTSAGGVVGNAGGTGSSSVRLISFKNILSRLRYVVIGRMAKPEEVLVIVNENGAVVRECMKNTASIVHYETMRETLVYLPHLDCVEVEKILTDKPEQQTNTSELSFKKLNTLCWAVGSISGAMNEMDESRFLVTVIKELLNMCEQRKGKDNKAIIAANVMYVVGQYPRYLTS